MNELVIIGGGVCRGDLTERMLGEIERADCLFIQTADMPTAQEALLRRPSGRTLDFCFEQAEDFDREVKKVIAEIMREHGRVIFNGNNYTEDWVKLAAERGLPNLPSTVEAAGALIAPENIAMLEKYHVLTRTECESRYEIMLENYSKVIAIEANTMLEMAHRQILPAVVDEAGACAGSYNALKAAGVENKSLKHLLHSLSGNISEISDTMHLLRFRMEYMEAESILEQARYCRDRIVPQMWALRHAADKAEESVSSGRWPMPSYTDLLHRV